MRKARYIAPALVSIVLLACGGDDKPGDPNVTPALQGTETSGSPSATPTVSAVLTPRAGVAANMARARELESEGNLEDALEVYVAVIGGAGSDRPEATVSAGRLLLELDMLQEARILLEPFAGPGSAHSISAHYLLARAYAAMKQWPQALAQYDLYIASGRPAVPYAYLDRAFVLLELDRPRDAALSAEAGLNAGVTPGSRARFRLTIAQSHERARDDEKAIEWYRALYDNTLNANDEALALSRIAAIKRGNGDNSYLTELETLYTSLPGTTHAFEAMEAALARGEQVPPYAQGLVYYRRHEYTKAEPHFRRQIDSAPQSQASAESYYYLAAILESRGDLDGALANYERATALNPNSAIADDALWWRARIYEQRGNVTAAAPLLERLVREFPNSNWAAEAAFRRGMLPYVEQRYAEAARVWGEGLLTASREIDRQRLGLWQAKALSKAGQASLALTQFQHLMQPYEAQYYGVRARNLLAGEDGQPYAEVEPNINLTPAFDWQAAEAWLVQRSGRALSDAAWTADPRWLRAQELWAIGRTTQADMEAFELIEANANDANVMYSMARRLAAQGRFSMSMRAGQRLIRTLDLNPNQGLPKALLSLSYPAAFAAETTRYAREVGISPLLMLAFIRQESAFNPRAVSPAGALGLTQVLPDTAELLTRSMNLPAASNEDLMHAELNLRLGARYMADQLRRFDNEFLVAFAAYNAGPTAAARWRDLPDAGDADVYLEAIEFGETRLYLRIVAENYAIYRYLYGGEPYPNLPD